MTVFIDFETRSRLSLDRGGWNYAEDDSTEITGLVALMFDDAAQRFERVVVWTPFDVPLRPLLRRWPGTGSPYGLNEAPVEVFQTYDNPPEPVIAAARAGRGFAAHNANTFDRLIWKASGLPEVTWLDTLLLARRRGLPGGLDALGAYLFGTGKSAGKKAMMQLAVPHKQTDEFIEPTSDMLSACMQYCLDDVLLMTAAFFEELHGENAACYPAWEQFVFFLDGVINERGHAFDADLATALISAEREVRAREAALVNQRTGGEVDLATLRSNKKLDRWLRDRGFYVPDLTAQRVEAIIGHPDTPLDVRTVLWARLGVMRIATAKLERALGHLHRGRVRGTMAYYAAHTGRWGGRGWQPQNLPRPNDRVDVKTAARVRSEGAEAIYTAAREAGCTPDDVISSLIRACIVPGAPHEALAVADYAAIEGRGVCWVAHDEEGLDTYREGLDPYIVMAAALYQREYDEILAEKNAKQAPGTLQRQAGKVAVLGCGYQMGAERFEAFATSNGVDLLAAGVTPRQAVEAWRDLHPAIAGLRVGRSNEHGVEFRTEGLWKRLGRLVMSVVEGSGDPAPVEGGRDCFWWMEGPHLMCRLPSGRPLLYRNARIEPVVPSWGGQPRPTVTYDHAHGSAVVRASTYGGKLTENIVQAICRDIMAAAIARLETAGFRVVLHVHDEVIVELADPDDVQRVVEIMAEPPPWAVGFPIAVGGHAAERYYKEPPRHARVAHASRERAVAHA